MSKDVVIVLDCGATNARAIAVDTDGKIVAKGVMANATRSDPHNPAWLIWSLDEILERFSQCARNVRAELDALGHRVAGITVTTFGVDGALVDGTGQLLYPVISWKCPRTVSIMENIRRYYEPARLQQLTGVGHFSFNTLYKLIWLKEHQPALLEQARAWLFISSLLVQRLTGVFSTDRTMAGTSQCFELDADRFSTPILEAIGVRETLFPRLVNPGEIVGRLLPEAASLLGLPAGVPVISAGHDTQFALFGSGAGLDQPVLSSGTWEILMARTGQVDTGALSAFEGSTCELDAQAGLFNPGLQWLASGVLEWVRETCWRGMESQDAYAAMIAEASAVPPGCDGVRMRTELLQGKKGVGGGAYTGLALNSTRGHLYRAALEALSRKLAEQLHELEQICGFKTEELILVGGGSRNRLWNQLKADALGKPVRVVAETEITVIGAALYALYGLGRYASPELARQTVQHDYQVFQPQ